jgi:hypothetical protein
MHRRGFLATLAALVVAPHALRDTPRAVAFGGKFFLAHNSSADRLHVWDCRPQSLYVMRADGIYCDGKRISYSI